MAAKEYKVSLAGHTVVVWANSAEQAARRAEREFNTGHVVTQRSHRALTNRTACKVGVKGYEEE